MNRTRLISVIGPECCGKTTLAQHLAAQYRGAYLPEYARTYLTKPVYTARDLLAISREQRAREIDFENSQPTAGVLDTDLLVIYVWWHEKYGTVPEEITTQLRSQTSRDYLLCSPDLPWHYDPLRENPTDRDRLFQVYKEAVRRFDFAFSVVSGFGEARLQCALNVLAAHK